MAQTLHLIVPGLFGPMPAAAEVAAGQRWPWLEKLLHRSDTQPFPGNDYESTLLSLFCVNSEHAFPTAPLRRVGDGGKPDDRYWLQLNPIFLRPDQDRLLVFSSEDLEFTLEEAQRLASGFEAHFAEEGWSVEVSSPHRWYLSLDSDPHLKVAELHQVLGRSMEPFLPNGEGAINWHGVLNEIQMLFFNHEVNTNREAAGKAPINGLWFSGGGLLPGVEAPAAWLMGGDVLAEGLSQQAGCELLSEGGELPGDMGDGIVIYDDLQSSVLHADPYRWMEGVTDFEQWFMGLFARLHNADARLILYPCDGQQIEVSSKVSWKFWNKPKPLLQLLNQNQLQF